MRKLQIILVIIVSILLVSCGESDDLKLQLNIGNDTVEINTLWTDSGAFLVTESETLVVYSSDTVDISTLGEYEIDYTITHQETEYTVTRMVIVVDQTPPVLTLIEGVDTVAINSTWVDGGCDVTDNSVEVLTCSTSSVVDTETAGIYEVVYTATDSSGNEGFISRMVTVVE